MGLTITVDGFSPDGPIPETFGFCALDGMGANRNPRVAWTGAPDGVSSFALLCVDPDAPTDATNVNKEGVTVPADLPRADFAHWVLVDIAAGVAEIAEGADSDGVTPGGKPTGPTALGVRGHNDFTGWFEGDADMGGTYGGYDGPCPPANDEIIHHYTFTVYALDTESLGLSGDFGVGDAVAAMAGHVLDQASVTGTYTLNPDVR
ncbi:MAG: YbhB/YbcL family Raf kinase inhibitor-like protein [Acidimicrobiales bacterium]